MNAIGTLRRTCPARGLTTLELLIVIMIVVILVALIFPSFIQARERARRDACVANERQLGIAMIQYADDNDYILPCGVEQPPGKPGTLLTHSPVGWASQIFPYVKDAGAYQCPDDPTSTAASWTWSLGCGPQPPMPPLAVVSYGYNERILETDSAGGNLNRLASPSSTILLFEVSGVATALTLSNEDASPCWTSRTYSAAGDGTRSLGSGPRGTTSLHPPPGAEYATGWFGGVNPAIYWPFGADVTFYGAPTGRHNGGSNFVMADGHAIWILPQAVQGNALEALPKREAAAEP